MRINPKVSSLALLLILVPLLTACNFKIPTNLEDLKQMVGMTEEQPAQDVRPNEEANEETSPFESNGGDSKNKVLGKLGNLLDKRKSMVCTYEADDGKVEIYTDGKNLKITIKGTMNGKPYEATSLFTGDYLYNWSNMQETGVKLSTKNMEGNPAYLDLGEELQREFDVNEGDFQYNCKEKALSKDTFELPKDMTFQEIGLPTVENGQVNMCGICDSINETAEKEECRKQFSCK